MPGFLGINTDLPKKFEKIDFSHIGYNNLVEDEIWLDDIFMKRSIIPKFLNDKLFFENSHIFICTDGTLLNAKDLQTQYKANNNTELIELMYQKHGITFVSKLRGDFSGAIYDKSEKKVKIFTNQIGSKPIYYFWDISTKSLIFCSELKVVLSVMRDLGFHTNLSDIGAYCLLSFGFMLKDYTLCENVKKLSPGSILTLDVEEGIISIEQYYQLKNTPYIEDTEENIINELDRRFSNAIKKEYDKDLEYGYKHVATLSGGLDSRTNILKGKMLGYKNILAISFSQSNYLDENIAKNIASDQGFNFLFYALDNGNYLKDIEKPVQANDGQILFWGSAHLLAMISLIDWDELGLLHTGMIGDLILGSYLFDKQHFKVSDKMIQKTAYSNKLINHIPKHIFEEMVQQYESDEMYAFYERCINGVFNGYLMTHHFTEFSSPFLYLDFLEYAMRIHPKIRYKQNIYHKWILTKIPEGSKYIWEKTGLPITAGELRGSLSVLLKQVKRKIYGPQRDSISMNPFNYWYETNSDLRNTFEDYYKQYICLLNNYPSLKEDTRNLFELGDSSEKTQVLTLLAAIKILDLNQNSKN